VELLRVTTGQESQADHGVFVDAGQAAGLANADTFLKVGEYGADFVVGESAVKQGSAGPLTEALLASAAGEVTALRIGAVAKGDAEVAPPPLSVVGAVRILAAEVVEFVHGVLAKKKVKWLPSLSC
jgi:hypothetical protein